MSFAFYLYTIIVMGVALVTASVALMVWLMTRRRDALFAVAGFCLYVLDMAVIFFDEYNRAKYSIYVTFSEPLQHPTVRCALGIAILCCLWCWTLMRLRVPLTRKHIGAYIVPLALLQIALVPRSGAAGQIQQYLFWVTRDLGIVACLAFAAWYYRFKSSDVERMDLDRSKTFFMVAVVLSLCVIAEDTYMILIADFKSLDGSLDLFFWYLSERNISENVLLVVSAVQLCRRFSHILRAYARHPRADEELLEDRRPGAEDDVASRLVVFADARGLSKREQEVLACALRGLDVRNIASELVISPGTVKAHLHRIYVKCGVNSRADLIEVFWRS